ncbi:hypothetical protein CYMTET_31866 [Cymbomonas tetramitiformis]|uniref:Uncharacterized protein n=1 Tax=Cymbomonas tetramitiformis TaxID=36881 RepID=A0AAE0FGL2_9CHLO|nr:hypothetical protein CYMTET_31866 [Cymbomonas tetramitiformis]
MIFMAAVEKIDEIRPLAETVFEGRGSLVTALPGMLEVLPLGASKATALTELLRHLKVPPERVLALGDGENDIEMLQMAGVGVAMGNAVQATRNVAAVTTASNNEDGWAQAIEKYVLQPKRRTL